MLCCSETTWDGLWCCKVVKGSVGSDRQTDLTVLLRLPSSSRLPDEPFHNFRASKSGDRLLLCSSGPSSDGFWGSKVVKGSVGSARSSNKLWAHYIIAQKPSSFSSSKMPYKRRLGEKSEKNSHIKKKIKESWFPFRVNRMMESSWPNIWQFKSFKMD